MSVGIVTATAADGRAFIRVFCRVEELRGEPFDMLDAPDVDALAQLVGAMLGSPDGDIATVLCFMAVAADDAEWAAIDRIMRSVARAAHMPELVYTLGEMGGLRTDPELVASALRALRSPAAARPS